MVINIIKGTILFNLDKILKIFNRVAKLKINVIMIKLKIKYTLLIKRKGIIKINGKIILTKGCRLFNSVFSSSCLKGKIVSKEYFLLF